MIIAGQGLADPARGHDEEGLRGLKQQRTSRPTSSEAKGIYRMVYDLLYLSGICLSDISIKSAVFAGAPTSSYGYVSCTRTDCFLFWNLVSDQCTTIEPCFQ